RMATEWHKERELQARLRAINRAGVQLTSTRHLEPVLRGALKEALSLTGSTAGSVMLVEGDRLRIYVAEGLDERVLKGVQPKVGEGIAGWVAKTGKPLVLRRGAVYKRSLSHPSPERAEAACCLPMKVRGEVIGVLNVKGKEEDFTQDDVNLLSVLASHAAAAIYNARLYERLERRVGELRALSEVATILSSSLDPKKVLSLIVKHSLSLLKAKRASVMLLEGETLRVVASKGLPRGASRAVVRIGEGIAGTVAKTGKPMVLKRGERHPLSRSRSAPAAISVPLEAKGRVVGVLNVSERADGGNFTGDDLDLLMHFARQAAVAIENAELYREIRHLFDGTINALAAAIDARDPYTLHHSERVSKWATEIAKEMGLPPEEVEAIRYAALLHDVGKIGIPESVLLKPAKLEPHEFALIQKHPVIGAQIVGTVREFHRIIPYIYHHHERFDSTGYPEGISGQDIPIGARIIAVADTYDALTSDRPYRKALPPEEAAWELKRAAGSQLDPEVVEAFLRILKRQGIKI
ncbi:MAG TPA: GAF domain-containing protein, partial [Armatimonadetes bacterium]|nr:GAF domain-containing protein [Armatimonadota bacterium]